MGGKGSEEGNLQAFRSLKVEDWWISHLNDRYFVINVNCGGLQAIPNPYLCDLIFQGPPYATEFLPTLVLRQINREAVRIYVNR